MDLHKQIKLAIKSKNEVELKRIMNLPGGDKILIYEFSCKTDFEKEDAEFLLKCGFDANSKNRFGDNLLTTSILFQRFEIFKLLIEYGAEYNLEKLRRKSLSFEICKEYIKYIEDFEEKRKNKKGIPMKE